MDDRERIQRERSNRFAFLKYLYDDNRQLKAGLLQSLPAQTVAQAIGISIDEGFRITEFLEERRLLTLMAMGPEVAITHTGIEEVEAALADPDKPSTYFPPIQVFTIHGGIHNSQVQQGTIGSSQHQTFTSEDHQSLTAAIAELRPHLAAIADPTAREELTASIDTVDAQLRRRSPSTAILKESLKSLRTVAEEVGAGLIVAKLLELAHSAGLL